MKTISATISASVIIGTGILLALVMIGISSSLAHAETKTPPKYSVAGKDVNISEAFKAALEGQPVTQCQQVLLTVNKSGTALGFKKVKPAKIAAQD